MNRTPVHYVRFHRAISLSLAIICRFNRGKSAFCWRDPIHYYPYPELRAGKSSRLISFPSPRSSRMTRVIPTTYCHHDGNHQILVLDTLLKD
jgi:hypothetical protein